MMREARQLASHARSPAPRCNSTPQRSTSSPTGRRSRASVAMTQAPFPIACEAYSGLPQHPVRAALRRDWLLPRGPAHGASPHCPIGVDPPPPCLQNSARSIGDASRVGPAEAGLCQHAQIVSHRGADEIHGAEEGIPLDLRVDEVLQVNEFVHPDRRCVSQARVTLRTEKLRRGDGLRQGIDRCAAFPAGVEQQASVVPAGDLEGEPPATAEVGGAAVSEADRAVLRDRADALSAATSLQDEIAVQRDRLMHTRAALGREGFDVRTQRALQQMRRGSARRGSQAGQAPHRRSCGQRPPDGHRSRPGQNVSAAQPAPAPRDKASSTAARRAAAADGMAITSPAGAPAALPSPGHRWRRPPRGDAAPACPAKAQPWRESAGRGRDPRPPRSRAAGKCPRAPAGPRWTAARRHPAAAEPAWPR